MSPRICQQRVCYAACKGAVLCDALIEQALSHRVIASCHTSACACRRSKGFVVGGSFRCDGTGACSLLKQVTKVRGAACMHAAGQGGSATRHMQGSAGCLAWPWLVHPCTHSPAAGALGCPARQGSNGWLSSGGGALCVPNDAHVKSSGGQGAVARKDTHTCCVTSHMSCVCGDAPSCVQVTGDATCKGDQACW